MEASIGLGEGWTKALLSNSLLSGLEVDLLFKSERLHSWRILSGFEMERVIFDGFLASTATPGNGERSLLLD